MGIASGMLIAKARIDKGISAAELARRVGVSRGFISLLEKDATHISVEKIRKIADVLGVSLSELGFTNGEILDQSPEWLKYLIDKFDLTNDDRRELLKLTARIGIPDNLPDETRKEFRERWEAFYQTVSIFLPNASVKMLRHPDVQIFIKGLVGSSNGSLTWDFIFDAFDRLIVEKVPVNVCNIDNGTEWLRVVCNLLNIYREEDGLSNATDFSMMPDVMAMKSFVQSSKRIYGAVLKDENGLSYKYIENRGNKIFDRGDFPIWHEAVRVLVDPCLRAKTGAYYYPDGEDRPPLEFVISRLAARLACWPFRDKWLEMKSDVTPISVQDFIGRVYPKLPWRVAYVGLLDFCKEPYVYLDCYKRLKRIQLKEKKIDMEDIAAMAKDADAKLRIGFVFRNLVAEATSFEMRHNMRIAEASTIVKAMSAQENDLIEGYDDLSQWKGDYDLKGCAKVFALRQIGSFGESHVRSIMKVCVDTKI